MSRNTTYPTRRERVATQTPPAEDPKEKTTATAHLNLATHSLGKLYAGYVLNVQGRQLNTAEAIDELSMAGARKIMPRELLESSGFEIPQPA